MKIKRRVSKGKKALNAVLAAALSASMVLGAAGIADVLVPTKHETAKAATTSSSLGSTTAARLTKISVGDTITFSISASGSYSEMKAKCISSSNGNLLFQSYGLTHGAWPGTNGKLGTPASNINSYDNYTQALVNELGNALSGALYLPTGTSTSDIANVYNVLVEAAKQYSSFGAASNIAWLGSPYGSGSAYYVNSGGIVHGSNGTSYDYVLAPAFNLKASYAWKTGSTFVKNVGGNAGISATQSKTSVNSWETTAVASIVSAAKNNVTGTSDRYTVKSDLGYVVNGGTDYKPTILNHDITDTITVSSVDNPEFTAATFKLNVVGVPDSKLHVTSDKIASGRTYDLSDIASSEIDGMKITDSLGYIKDGKYVVPGTARDLVDKITFSVGTYSATKEVNIAANTDIKQDSEGYYVVNDDNGIEWHFLYNDSGQIGYLYASSANIGKLVTNDSSKTLNVPSTINGVTVAGIGTNSSAHNFLNDTDGATGSTVWKNIYIPASVKTIRGYAFAGNTASAKVEIPSTVQNIEEHAFDGSSITEVKFDDASKLTIGELAFANIPTLTTVTLRGNGTKIGTMAFYNDGIQKLNIPAGTTMEADSNAFSNNEQLTELKIDATTVPDNTFVDTPKLAKVVFGEDVKQVNALWTGKQAEANGTFADRTTYALGKDTIFNCKQDGSAYYSPFGIAGTLNVWGLQSGQVFNNGGGPVYAFNSGANNAFAKGEASSETTHIATTTKGMEGLGDGDVYDQTGIEASYSTTLLGGANATKDASTLNKDNMTVRKLYGADAKGTYKSSDFYVMRSQKYDNEVKGKTFANYTTEGNINTIKDAETEKMLAFYKDEDGVQVNDTDVKNGAVTVTVVVLQSITADGKTYYLAKQNQGNSASMLTYTCEVTIPVKQYSEFNLFNDVYGGDFTKITQAISDAQAKNDKLQADLTAKEAEATKLQTQLDAINKKLSEAGITAKTDESGNVDVSGAVETLEQQKADLEKQLKGLKAQIGVSDDTDVSALKAQITTLKKQSDDYAALLSQYQSVIEKLQAGKGPVASDVKSDTITTGDVTVTNDVPAGTYVYGDDGKWHEGSKDGKVVDGITTGEKTPNSGDTITVKVNNKPALTEDELKTLDGSKVIETLEQQLEDQKKATAQAEANYRALKDQTDKSAAEAQKNLEEAQKQQAEIQSQLDAAKKAKEEADKTLNDANATAEEKQAALQKQVDTLNTQVESLTKTNKEQGDKLTELQGNVASLGAQVSQYKDVADTVASIAGIDVKGKSAAEVKEALSTMANEYVADKKAITTIAEKAGVDPTTVASDPDAFAKTVSDKIDGSGSPLTDTERKSLNDKIAELTKQNTELQSTNKTLQDKINGSGNSGGSSSDTADMTMLKAQLAAAQTQADTYKAQADTYKDLYNTAAKSNGTSAEDTAKIASLTTENATLTSKNKSLSDTNDELTEQNSSLAETNESLTEKNSSLTKTNKSLKSSNSSLKKQLSAARKNSGKTKTITKKVPVTKVQTVTKTVPVTKTRTITKTVKQYVNADRTITSTPKKVDTSKSNDSDKKDDSQSHGSVSLGNQGGTPTDTDNKGTITTPDADTQSSSDNDLPDASSSSTSTSSSSGDQGTDPTATPGNGDNSLGSGSEGTVNDGSNKKPKNTSWIYILVAAAAGLAALGGLYMVKAKKPQSASANDYDADIDDDDIDDDDDDDDTDDDE